MFIRAIPFVALTFASFAAGGATVWATISVGSNPSQPAQIVAMSTSHREVRDVPWFKSHTDDRKAKLIACNDNPGLGMHDPECVNAEDAKSKVDIEAFLSGIGK